MARNVIIGLLLVAALGAGGFAFFQTQNLTELQDTSTQVASDLRDAGTQSAGDAAATGTQQADRAIATGTSFAESSFETATEAAQIARDNADATQTELADSANATQTELADNVDATQTEFADNADATQTQLAEDANAASTQQADNANATQTQLADEALARQNQLAENAAATGTQQADNANEAATQSANLAATQANIGTDTANNLATQQIELTVAAIVFTDSQATSDAENIGLVSTLEAIGMGGEGVQGTSADIPATFDLFEGEGYELVLAKDFVGGDFVGDDTDDLEDELSDADLDDIFDNLSEQDNDFLFFAVDTMLVRGVSRATISLIREEALNEGLGLQEYISCAIFGLQGDFALITSDIVSINGQATGRIIIDQQLSDAAVRQVQYIFAVDNQFYVLTFTTPIIEYANVREIVETTAASLRIRD